MKEALIISACLMGERCRYDGKSHPLDNIDVLKERFHLIPICPEVMGGLSTPRLPCEIQCGRVIRSDGADMTKPYQKGAEASLAIAQKKHCKKALLKEKSPSCGKNFRYDGSFSAKLTEGSGITTELFLQNGITVWNETEIDRI